MAIYQKNYSKHTNHGFDQALIQYQIGLSFYSDVFSDSFDIGSERLMDELKFAFTEEGVHKENSPGYQSFMLARVQSLIALRGLGDSIISPLAEEYKDKASSFLCAITLPDGTLPLIGDTRGAVFGERNEITQDLIVYDYAASGYVIIKGRDSSGLEFCLILKNSHESNYHRHDDDLSLYFYYDGVTFFGDGGLLSYNEKDPHRIFLRSPLAHSVPVLNRDAIRDRNKLSEFPTIEWVTDSVFKATSWMFGVKVTRQIDFTDICLGKIVVLDQCIAPESVELKSNFMIPDCDDIKIIQNEVLLQNGCRTVSLSSDSGINPLSIYQGSSNCITDSAILSEKYGEIRDATRVSFDGNQKAYEIGFFTNRFEEDQKGVIDKVESIAIPLNSMPSEKTCDLNAWDMPIYHYGVSDDYNDHHFDKDGIHRIDLGFGQSVDICIQGMEAAIESKKTDVLLVGFAAAIASRQEKNKKAPFFSGLNISRGLALPLISIADPSLALSQELALGWHAGNQGAFGFPQRVASILDSIAMSYSSRLLLFGGSGGGFASLILGTLLKSQTTIAVWNPQTSIGEYNRRMVLNYIKIAFPQYTLGEGDDTNLHDALEELGILHDLRTRTLNENVEVFYLQNDSDWLVKSHAISFLKRYPFKRVGLGVFETPDKKMTAFIGTWGEGHVAPPNECIKELLSRLAEGEGPGSLARALEGGLGGMAPLVKGKVYLALDPSLQLNISVNSSEKGYIVRCDIDASDLDLAGVLYAFYLMIDEVRVDVYWYSLENEVIFSGDYPEGKVEVIAFVKDKFDQKIRQKVALKLES